MHTEGLVKMFSSGAVRRASPLQIRPALIFTALLLSVSAFATGTAGAKNPEAQSNRAVSADYVGSDTCTTCHEETSKKFSTNPHSKLALEHGNGGVTCEGCHGPGKSHVDGGGDTSKIFNPSKATAQEVDKTCLNCHAGKHANFELAAHAKANVSCIACHSIHASKELDQLLKSSQPNLCYQCHADEKAQFSMPFHHKVNEGAIDCSDCHDPHGTFNKLNLRNTADQNAICTKCHTETRGPFVFEHAAVKAEGCMGCHTPHGSQNARLLNMPSVNTLCSQCHSAVAAGTVHGMDSGSQTVQPCVSCHTMIHGSNASQAFIR